MLRDLPRAIRLVFEAAWPLVVATMLLTLAEGILPLASLYCLKLAIDILTDVSVKGHEQSGGELAVLIGFSGGFYLLHQVVKLAAAYVNEAMSLRVTERTQEMIASKANRVELRYYENPEYFDTLHQAQREAPHRLSRLVGAFSQILRSGFSFAAIGGLLMFSMHWTAAVVAAAVTLPTLAFRIRYASHLYRWQRCQTGAEREVGYYEWLLSSTRAAKEARLFNLGKLFAERAALLRRKLGSEKLGLARHRLKAECITQSAAAIAATGVAGFMSLQAWRGVLTVGDVVLNYQAFQRGIIALHELAGAISTIYESNLFIGRLFQFLDLPEPHTPGSPRSFPPALRRGIEFHEVSFSYGERDVMILDGVSFEIAAGQMVAIVGENGAGKSTLIKLVCGLYEPTQGRITIDGIDIREFDRRELWDSISVLFQDYGQYFVSAEENIWFGDIAGVRSGECVRRAAEQSGADEVIAEMPLGYEQQLGSLFEGGQELSVGQWQKIALSRAFFRETPIIILDEPSSALDVKAEHDVFQKFRTLTRGRTSIVISHRLSTVRMADRIFLLNGGRVVEAGSHAELVNSGGLYADLFETQASSYR